MRFLFKLVFLLKNVFAANIPFVRFSDSDDFDRYLYSVAIVARFQSIFGNVINIKL